MSDVVPHGVCAPETAADDPRLGHWLAKPRDPATADVVLLGFPSDEGVRRNGGRPGAAEGPRALRESLYRLTPDAVALDSFLDVLERTADAGDVVVTGDVEEDQQRLGRVAGPLLQQGKVLIVLGGGHETAFGHFLGFVRAEQDVRILNWDAHADVRPLRNGQAHSGSPFRQAIEHPSGRCRRYDVAGLQPHSTAQAHADYVRQHGGDIVWRPDLDLARVRQLADGVDGTTMASFDLDAVDASAAPGVSAINPGGNSVTEWLAAAYGMGSSPTVRSMDVVELNPRFDQDGRTARLAALTVWHFLRGLATRQTPRGADPR